MRRKKIECKLFTDNKRELANFMKDHCIKKGMPSSGTYHGTIFHDGEKKCAVATDSHVLMASKSEYNENFAGKMVDLNGEVFEDLYPKWTCALPSSEGTIGTCPDLSEEVERFVSSPNYDVHNKKTCYWVQFREVYNKKDEPCLIDLYWYYNVIMPLGPANFKVSKYGTLFYEDDDKKILLMGCCLGMYIHKLTYDSRVTPYPDHSWREEDPDFSHIYSIS